MNGSMPLFLSPLKHFVVFGGPYRLRPMKLVGVCMAEELSALPADVRIPVRDYNVPTQKEMRDGVDKVVNQILLGRPVYAGCMGGIGRTGLLFACLAKAFGEAKPVEFVRQHYIPHAVETTSQMRFVAEFQPSTWTRNKIKAARFFFGFSRKTLLTDVSFQAQ